MLAGIGVFVHVKIINILDRTHHSNEIYHIYNRGVDKRDVFMTSDDYRYFIHLLYILNDSKKANNTKRNLSSNPNKNETDHTHGRGSTSTMKTSGRNCLVDILAYCLMPNHYHLLIKQNQEEGIAKFMQKIGTGYTMYFNKKYSRSGSLFQGRYKSVHIINDSQLLYIPHYIHLNPIPLIRSEQLVNKNTYLEEYRWSSYPDYINKKNFPSLIKPAFILDQFGGHEAYALDIQKFITTDDYLDKLDASLLIDSER